MPGIFTDIESWDGAYQDEEGWVDISPVIISLGSLALTVPFVMEVEGDVVVVTDQNSHSLDPPVSLVMPLEFVVAADISYVAPPTVVLLGSVAVELALGFSVQANIVIERPPLPSGTTAVWTPDEPASTVWAED
jgi:hypothetical protein